MPRMIDQIRASKLPSNMMQFAARGALQVSPAENIEILVYLARHNQVFGDVARMTLAGWVERFVVTPTKLAVDWTEKGLEQAKLLNGIVFQTGKLSLSESACLEFLIQQSRISGGKR